MLPALSWPNIATISGMEMKFEPSAHSRAVSDAVLCGLAGTMGSVTTHQKDITAANAGGAGRAPTVNQASRNAVLCS